MTKLQNLKSVRRGKVTFDVSSSKVRASRVIQAADNAIAGLNKQLGVTVVYSARKSEKAANHDKTIS